MFVVLFFFITLLYFLFGGCVGVVFCMGVCFYLFLLVDILLYYYIIFYWFITFLHFYKNRRLQDYIFYA